MSTPPTVSALPEVPATSDPQFEIKAPALFNAIKNTFVGEVNAVASWINAGSWLTNPLAAGSGGTGLTTIPAGRIMYGNDTSAVATSANLTFTSGNQLNINGLAYSWGRGRGFVSVGAGSDLVNFEALTCSHDEVNGGRFIMSGVGTGTIRDFAWIQWDGTSVYELMRLKASGNLGIGTTTPRCPLHTRVSGTGVQEVGRLTATFTGNDSGPLLRFTNVVAGGTNPSTGEYNLGGIAGYDEIGSWGGGLRFYTAPNGTTGGANLSLAMTLTPASDLGIGTTTPAAKLHVVKTTEQLRLGYDASNYTGLETDSGGNFIINPTGGGIRINQSPAGSAGAATGTYLTLNLNGTAYKIALLANA